MSNLIRVFSIVQIYLKYSCKTFKNRLIDFQIKNMKFVFYKSNRLND